MLFNDISSASCFDCLLAFQWFLLRHLERMCLYDTRDCRSDLLIKRCHGMQVAYHGMLKWRANLTRAQYHYPMLTEKQNPCLPRSLLAQKLLHLSFQVLVEEETAPLTVTQGTEQQGALSNGGSRQATRGRLVQKSFWSAA
jgi:hypothetical protein